MVNWVNIQTFISLLSYITLIKTFHIWFQVIFSMADEYVPDYVDKKALVER